MKEAYRLILESAGDGIYGLDPNGLTTFANPATEALTGWSAEELIGKPQHAILHHSYPDKTVYPRELCPIYMALRDGLVHRSESEVFWRKDGTSFPVSYTSTPILREGKPCGAVVMFKDISERRRQENWQRNLAATSLAITSHAPLDDTLDMIAQAFVELYPSGAIAILTAAGKDLLLSSHAGIPQALEDALTLCEIGDRRFACSQAAELGKAVRIQSVPHADVGKHYRELSCAIFDSGLAVPVLSSSGKVLGVVAIFAAAAEAIAIQEKETVICVCDFVRMAVEHDQLLSELTRQSQYDRLTGLPNRLVLEDRLEQAIVHARRNGTQVALCYVDLDHFKQINDTLGHSAGDTVLQHVARVLKESVRDIDTVARQGGDEFILVLPDLKGDSEADDIANKILARLRSPVAIGEHIHVLNASIGRSIFPGDGETATTLLQNADIALYAAKSSGRDRVQQFNRQLGETLHREIELQRELRFALERQQLTIVYQPLCSRDRQIKGFEALLRWFHPIFGQVSPEKFVSLAEKAGLIVPIGEWVLNEACRQAQEWNSVSGVPIRVFVNTSGVQLQRPEFVDTVATALSRSGLAANLLEIEITETWVVADTEAASIRLRQLRELGVCISIDDFGSGNASFSYLQQLPVDTIKIDRSFIASLDGTPKSSAIARAIIALAAELDLQTVAEGIETEQQFDELKGTQCDLFQGFLFASPLSPLAIRLAAPEPAKPDRMQELVIHGA